MMQCFQNLEENNFLLWSKEIQIIGLAKWTRAYKVCVWNIRRTQCGSFKCAVRGILSMHRLSTAEEVCSLWRFYGCCVFLDVQMTVVFTWHQYCNRFPLYLKATQFGFCSVYSAWQVAQADSLLPGIWFLSTYRFIKGACSKHLLQSSSWD